MQNDLVTFDDVMLDWAIAELLSSTWVEYWASPACDELREKIRSAGIGSLSVDERIWLMGEITRIRSPILSVYGPHRSWSVRRTVVPRQELSKFSIIHHFGYPSFSFGHLA